MPLYSYLCLCGWRLKNVLTKWTHRATHKERKAEHYRYDSVRLLTFGTKMSKFIYFGSNHPPISPQKLVFRTTFLTDVGLWFHLFQILGTIFAKSHLF